MTGKKEQRRDIYDLRRRPAQDAVQPVLDAWTAFEKRCHAVLDRVEERIDAERERREAEREAERVAYAERLIDEALKKHERESLWGFRTLSKAEARRRGLIL